jgi:hypothetical protein
MKNSCAKILSTYYAFVLLFVVLLTVPCVLFSQSKFVRVYGGSSYDHGTEIVLTNDGGYAVAALTASFGGGSNNYENYLLMKFDADWNLQWARTLGGPEGDQPYALIHTQDGGYAIGGWINGLGPGYLDCLIAKYDSTGNLEWARALGTDYAIPGEFLSSLIQTTAGDYVMVGNKSEPTGFLIAKFDGSGNLLWKYNIREDSNYDVAFSVIQTNDHGYAITGRTFNNGPGDQAAFIIKLDSLANLQWARNFGGSGLETGYCLIQTSDWGFAIVGQTSSFGGGGTDILLTKFGIFGDFQWAKAIGSSGDDIGLSLIQTGDSSYIIAGYTNSFGGGDEALLIKCAANGNVIWANALGGNGDETARSLIQDKDDGYIITGSTFLSFDPDSNIDILIAKYDTLGHSCIGTMVTPIIFTPSLEVLSVTPDIYAATHCTVNSPSLTLTAPTPAETTICEEYVGIGEFPEFADRLPVDLHIPSFFRSSIEIHFSSSCNMPLEVSVRNAAGIAVYRKQFQSRPYQIVLQGREIAELPSGVYFVSFTSEAVKGNYKIVKIK